jgi:hypothetical protein
VSEDPAQDGLNWYAYTNNNPLAFFDPTGQFAEQVDAINSSFAQWDIIGTLGVFEKTDSLNSLAKSFYNDLAMKELIITANNLDADNPIIMPGQVLYIPKAQAIRDDNGTLKGYSFVDVAAGKSADYTSIFLEYKHNEAINRKSSWKYQYAQFGSATGNAGKDVAGNLAIAAVVFVGHQAATGGAVYASAEKLYLDVSIKTYLAGQQLWNRVSEKAGKVLNWSQRQFYKLWKGSSTGRTTPVNLTEQFAMKQAISNPQAGMRVPITMSDPRWPAKDGWMKMRQNINGVEIHYVLNKLTGIAEDFKFK